jgi:hypothetical protein
VIPLRAGLAVGCRLYVLTVQLRCRTERGSRAGDCPLQITRLMDLGEFILGLRFATS